MTAAAAGGGLRLDKLLWYLRFSRSRSLAQAMIATGHIRVDGRRIERASAIVRAGQVIVLPLGERIAVLRLTCLPLRRGLPEEAAGCYDRLDAPSSATAE